jgi:hypothetical protein
MTQSSSESDFVMELLVLRHKEALTEKLREKTLVFDKRSCEKNLEKKNPLRYDRNEPW